jgi:hypothetical protein
MRSSIASQRQKLKCESQCIRDVSCEAQTNFGSLVAFRLLALKWTVSYCEVGRRIRIGVTRFWQCISDNGVLLKRVGAQ